MDQRFLVPIDAAQIKTGADQANFIPDPMCDHGRFRVVENDALFAIDPTLVLVYSCHDRVEAEGKQAVCEHSPLRVKSLAPPRKQAYELRNLRAEPCA